MKKFIVFCLILIVTVSLGVTVFYFMRDNEELVVNADPYIYVNVGEDVEIDATLKHAKVGNEVVMTSLTESVLEWNPAINKFVAMQGGAAVVEVRTNNSRIPAVHIQVNVGNGMKEAPYYIDSEGDLLNIGKPDSSDVNFKLSDCYILQQDITLSSNFTPIATGDASGFTGTFNGNGYSIKNLTVTDGNGINNAGLFAKIGATGVVTNLTLNNVNVNGQFENAGSIAGVNLGSINRVEVLNGSVISTLADSNVGGIAGLVEYSNSNVGRIDRSMVSLSVSGTTNVGGLCGKNNGGILINSYVSLEDNETISVISDNAIAGGLVGLNSNYSDYKRAVVKNCYSIATVLAGEGLNNDTIKLASLIGNNQEISAQSPNYLMGNYTDNTNLPTANHTYNLTFAQNEKSKEVNFRGLYNEFPKDANDKIIAAELISYVPSKIVNGQELVTWNFVNVWVIDVNTNEGYPVLNKLGADVPDDISIALDESLIKNATDLINAANAINDGKGLNYYILENDITLTGNDFIPLGTNEKPFFGTFEGNGKTIKNLTVSSETIEEMGTGNNKLVGLFGKITSNAVIRNLTIDTVSIADGATYAGAVVGYSEGTIENVKVTGIDLNREANTISGTYAVGGIAGLSLGTINNCKVENQTIVTKAISKNASRYLGGIAGLNGLDNNSAKATITNSSVVTTYIYDNETNESFPSDFRFRKSSRDFIGVLTKAQFFVGGIAGANYYQLTQNYVYNSDIQIDNYATLGVVAGIAGLSKGTAMLNEGLAEVSYNKVLGGTIKGFAAAGLVNYLYGIAQYNHVEAQTIYGLIVSGLTSDIKINGRLNNCFVKSHLVNFSVGNYANGSAGMTNYARFQNKKYYGEFRTIFSACTFESTNYVSNYDSNADYRQESNVVWDTRVDGYGNYLIWVETGHAKHAFGSIVGDTRQNDIYGISNEEAKFMMNEQNIINLFTRNGFDTEHWTFETMAYATIIGLPEIEELD